MASDRMKNGSSWEGLEKAGRPQGVCLGVPSGWGRGWASPPLDGTPGGRARWGRAHAGFLGQRLGVYPGSPERTPPCEAGEEPMRRQPGSPIPAAQREAGWPARGSPGIQTNPGFGPALVRPSLTRRDGSLQGVAPRPFLPPPLPWKARPLQFPSALPHVVSGGLPALTGSDRLLTTALRLSWGSGSPEQAAQPCPRPGPSLKAPRRLAASPRAGLAPRPPAGPFYVPPAAALLW